jgi:hypothetical protein
MKIFDYECSKIKENKDNFARKTITYIKML